MAGRPRARTNDGSTTTVLLIRAFELHEAVYEVRNRPHGLTIAAALDRLLPQPTPQPSDPTTEPRP